MGIPSVKSRCAQLSVPLLRGGSVSDTVAVWHQWHLSYDWLANDYRADSAIIPITEWKSASRLLEEVA
jgi:hypothetical protein